MGESPSFIRGRAMIGLERRNNRTAIGRLGDREKLKM
jgi:hypothetical protein